MEFVIMFNIFLRISSWTGNVLSRQISKSKYMNKLCSDISIMVRVFANSPGDLVSIPGRVISKTQNMVLNATLLNTQHYTVRIKGKVEQFRVRSSALPHTLV